MANRNLLKTPATFTSKVRFLTGATISFFDSK